MKSLVPRFDLWLFQSVLYMLLQWIHCCSSACMCINQKLIFVVTKSVSKIRPGGAFVLMFALAFQDRVFACFEATAVTGLWATISICSSALFTVNLFCPILQPAQAVKSMIRTKPLNEKLLKLPRLSIAKGSQVVQRTPMKSKQTVHLKKYIKLMHWGVILPAGLSNCRRRFPRIHFKARTTNFLQWS